MKLYQQGVLMLTVRFEDLTTLPKQAIEKIFEYCNISTANRKEVFTVLDQDSQADTVLSQNYLQEKSIELPEDFLAEMERTSLEHPIVKTSRFVVPNTWHPE